MSIYKRSDQRSRSSFSITSRTNRRVLILIMSFLSAILDRRRCVASPALPLLLFCFSSLADYAEGHVFPAAEPFSDYLIIILPLLFGRGIALIFFSKG